MPLTQEQEDLEHQIRIQQMKADVELKEGQALKVRQDWRLDPQRVVIQAFLAGAAIVGALGSVLGYLIGKAH